MARQNGAAMRSSRLFWATPGIPRGAGTPVAGAGGKDLHLCGDVGAPPSRHAPALVAPSPSAMFFIWCYVQLNIQGNSFLWSFSFE